MKHIKTIAIIALVVYAIIGGCSPKGHTTRDFSYERYCDSIWENDPIYYMDVLVETDEYQDYIESHGEWWK